METPRKRNAAGDNADDYIQSYLEEQLVEMDTHHGSFVACHNLRRRCQGRGKSWHIYSLATLGDLEVLECEVEARLMHLETTSLPMGWLKSGDFVDALDEHLDMLKQPFWYDPSEVTDNEKRLVALHLDIFNWKIRHDFEEEVIREHLVRYCSDLENSLIALLLARDLSGVPGQSRWELEPQLPHEKRRKVVYFEDVR